MDKVMERIATALEGIERQLAKSIGAERILPPAEEHAAIKQVKENVAKLAEAAMPTEPLKAKPPSIDDVRSALKAFSKKEGSEATLKLIEQIGGAKTVSAVPEEKRAALIEACK